MVVIFILVFPAAIFAQVAVQPFGTDAEAYGASPSASASTNTTAIQTALNFGGLVTLTTCGTYNVSGRLIISSNTYFRIAPCVSLFQANGTNNNMLVNNNYTQRGYVSGTLTYSSGTISGSGCPAQGQTLYLLFSGKSNPNASGYGLYGTATMGAGGIPGNVTIVNTGGGYTSIPATWTAQANGTTFFDFVNPNPNLGAGNTGALANCTGTLTFTGGTLSTGHPSAIQTFTQSGTEITATVSSTTRLVANQSWVIIFGNSNPHAYNGVFQVESVLNGTQFTFHTMLLPSGAPSGASGWMLADTNIAIDGGVWNYNAANQNTNNTREGCSFVVSGAENVEIKNVLFQNPTQDDILDGMVRDFYVHDSSDTGATALQFIKSDGPNFNSRVERIRSVGVDDGVTWMNDEGAVIDLYPHLVWTWGDVINAGADHIDRMMQGTPLGASGDVVFFPGPNAYMGGVYAKNVTGSNSVTDSQSSAVRTIPCVAFQGVGANSVLDSFYGENINCNGAWGFRMGNVVAAISPIWTARAVNINQLTCHQQLASNAVNGNAGQACVYEDPGTNVKVLSINQITVADELITNTTGASYIWIFGGVELLNLSNPKMTPSSAPSQPSDLLRIDSSTIQGLGTSHANVTKATISGLNQTYGDRVINITPGNPNTPTIVLRDSYIGSKVGVLAASSANIILDSDTFTNASTGAVQTDDFDATANITVNAYANNTTIVSGNWGAIAGTDGSFTSTFTWFDQGGNSPSITLPAGDSKNLVSWGAPGSPKLIPTPSWCPSGCTNGILSANLAPTTLYTPTANGTYRLTVYLVLTSAGGGGSTLPSATSTWTDADTNVAISAAPFTPTNAGNTVGLANSAGGTIGTNSGTIVFQARANTAIQVGTTGYAGGSPPMQYAVHPKLEYLGP